MIFINSVNFPGENGTDCRSCELCGKPIHKAQTYKVPGRKPWDKWLVETAELCDECFDFHLDMLESEIRDLYGY